MSDVLNLLERLRTKVNLDTLGEDRLKIESALDALGDTSGTHLTSIWKREVKSGEMPEGKLDVIDDIMASRFGREYTKYLKGQVGESILKDKKADVGKDVVYKGVKYSPYTLFFPGKKQDILAELKRMGIRAVFDPKYPGGILVPVADKIKARKYFGESKGGDNIYMRMPIDRVISDAKNGVSAAKDAWYKRDREGASKELGHIKYPGEEKESKVKEKDWKPLSAYPKRKVKKDTEKLKTAVSKSKISWDMYKKPYADITKKEAAIVDREYNAKKKTEESKLKESPQNVAHAVVVRMYRDHGKNLDFDDVLKYIGQLSSKDYSGLQASIRDVDSDELAKIMSGVRVKESKLKECVCHIYGMKDDELLEFYKGMRQSYKKDGAMHQFPTDQAEVILELQKRKISFETKDIESPEATMKIEDKPDIDPEEQSMEPGDKEPEKSKQDTMTKPTEKELEQLLDKTANEDVGTMFAQDKVDIYQKKIDELNAQAKQLEQEQKGTKKSSRGYNLQNLYAKIDEYERKIAQARSSMGERKQLYICNSCTLTFRNDTNECIHCKSNRVEKIGVSERRYTYICPKCKHETNYSGLRKGGICSECDDKGFKVKMMKTPVKAEESKLSEQEKENLTIIAKGIVDKREADEMARDKKGMVVQDENDEKKFMVVVKEENLKEENGKLRSEVIEAMYKIGYSLSSEGKDVDEEERVLHFTRPGRKYTIEMRIKDVQ